MTARGQRLERRLPCHSSFGNHHSAIFLTAVLPANHHSAIIIRQSFHGSECIMLMKYRLYTPGPTSVPEATLLELARPVRHHRTAEFRAMFAEVQTLLQYVFQTKQTVHTITGSGTAAAEAGIVSTLGAGKKALCVTNGKF